MMCVRRSHDINRNADSIARFSDVEKICDIGVLRAIWQGFNHPSQNWSTRFMLARMLPTLPENVLCLLTRPPK